MPCLGPTDDEMRSQALAGLPLAALCAPLTVIESGGRLSEMLASLDYQEGGFTGAELEEWWSRHKEEDATRRRKEAEERRREELRQSALQKLTPAEKQALGIN